MNLCGVFQINIIGYLLEKNKCYLENSLVLFRYFFSCDSAAASGNYRVSHFSEAPLMFAGGEFLILYVQWSFLPFKYPQRKGGACTVYEAQNKVMFTLCECI